METLTWSGQCVLSKHIYQCSFCYCWHCCNCTIVQMLMKSPWWAWVYQATYWHRGVNSMYDSVDVLYTINSCFFHTIFFHDEKMWCEKNMSLLWRDVEIFIRLRLCNNCYFLWNRSNICMFLIKFFVRRMIISSNNTCNSLNQNILYMLI